MNKPAICVEDLGKLYKIGARLRHRTMRDALTAAITEPFRSLTTARQQDEIWALRDVTFSIEQGEMVGIIGSNGAGKSTLLKILSRITKPTTGCVRIRGRVGSLLEVGTGFHPELSGRENIYLNGSILGMRKTEIQRRFDEIVAFAEVDKFLDTPIKHYSSGMYVRLAFAVAAHLEPTILIVDEVLAVGDVAFQKKCMGKMGDVAREGRTVLFVSHNMDAIQQLCRRCLLLEGGQLKAQGDCADIITHYLSVHSHGTCPNQSIDLSSVQRSGTGEARFTKVQYSSQSEITGFRPYSTGPLEFLLTIDSDASRSVGSLALFLSSQLGTKLVNVNTITRGHVVELRKGYNQIRVRLDEVHLNPGIYRVGLWLADPISSRTNSAYDYVESAFEMEVVKSPLDTFVIDPHGFIPCRFNVEVVG